MQFIDDSMSFIVYWIGAISNILQPFMHIWSAFSWIIATEFYEKEIPHFNNNNKNASKNPAVSDNLINYLFAPIRKRQVHQQMKFDPCPKYSGPVSATTFPTNPMFCSFAFGPMQWFVHHPDLNQWYAPSNSSIWKIACMFAGCLYVAIPNIHRYERVLDDPLDTMDRWFYYAWPNIGKSPHFRTIESHYRRWLALFWIDLYYHDTHRLNERLFLWMMKGNCVLLWMYRCVVIKRKINCTRKKPVRSWIGNSSTGIFANFIKMYSALDGCDIKS